MTDTDDLPIIYIYTDDLPIIYHIYIYITKEYTVHMCMYEFCVILWYGLIMLTHVQQFLQCVPLSGFDVKGGTGSTVL